MKRVLVTGAGGFIGRHCVPALVESGFEVHATDLQLDLDFGPDVQFHPANLMDPAQVQLLVQSAKPSHLLHLAWETTPGSYWNSPSNLQWIRASQELLTRFTSRSVDRAVAAGTCAEYDWTQGYCSESRTPLRPRQLYGESKNTFREIFETDCNQKKLSYTWGRIFHLFGPGEKPDRLVPSIILDLLHNRLARCTHGMQLRDFLYVKDVASAFVSILNSKIQGAVNIGSGIPMRVRDVIAEIARLLDRSCLVKYGAVPMPMDEPTSIVADVRRLNQEVGWFPSFSLEKGLEETIRWWQDRM